MRGVNIGYIKNIKTDLNSILVLVYIKSINILVPKNSIIETNQAGLLNDAVIDIIPLEVITDTEISDINVLSKECYQSKFLCHFNYLYGERGLNYDDLIRSATRISQRFDDPHFFSLFYNFLKNCIKISSDVSIITSDIAHTTSLFYDSLLNFLLNHI